jgi:hypothetical protein
VSELLAEVRHSLLMFRSSKTIGDWGVLRIGTIKYGLESHPSGTVLARTISNSELQTRQRGRYKITNPQLSKRIQGERKIGGGSQMGADTKTDGPTDCRS